MYVRWANGMFYIISEIKICSKRQQIHMKYELIWSTIVNDRVLVTVLDDPRCLHDFVLFNFNVKFETRFVWMVLRNTRIPKIVDDKLFHFIS